jgi:hypothetical protein
MARSVPATTDLEGLGLDTGGHLLVDHALAPLWPGDQLTVTGRDPALSIHLAAWFQIHPHFREVMQLLATQAADEARHVEVFSRRALLSGGPLGTSGAGGRASLQTLLGEPDFTTASFLLSVLGEGTLVDLLRFLHRHAPDPVTAGVTRLALHDEARHVAFGGSPHRARDARLHARAPHSLVAVLQTMIGARD